MEGNLDFLFFLGGSKSEFVGAFGDINVIYIYSILSAISFFYFQQDLGALNV
jgi:hypothetical protein